jgi:hypothetical protein
LRSRYRESPHYSVSSILLLVPPRWAQISSSAPSS